MPFPTQSSSSQAIKFGNNDKIIFVSENSPGTAKISHDLHFAVRIPSITSTMSKAALFALVTTAVATSSASIRGDERTSLPSFGATCNNSSAR